VEDHGAGFNFGTVERGHGIANMSDRIATLGGALDVDSTTGTGTRVTARLPATG
jgi:signal transduction histidine kinase